MGLVLIKCPSCYSSRSSAIAQCQECEHIVCNHCDVGGGLFNSRKCPKCGSSRLRKVGNIK